MPIVDSGYVPPRWPLRNRYLMFLWMQARRAPRMRFSEEFLEIRDRFGKDEVQLDRLCTGARRAAILVPGLEGNTGSTYMLGMALRLAQQGWDIVGYNFRGCNGKPNRLARTYHGADTASLEEVVQRVVDVYDEVALVGFSLGANIVLKYLGIEGSQSRIVAGVAISPPCDFQGAVQQWESGFINKNIVTPLALRSMRKKAKAKADVHIISRDLVAAYDRVGSVASADHYIHAPLNGYESGAAYWRDASSKPVIGRIETPTLIVMARDDFMLSPGCYPIEEARQNANVSLEMPARGSHVAFVPRGRKKVYWTERRTSRFLDATSRL